MKTKIKRHSRSVISVLLAVCMIISCMTVGIIATDAAKDDSESVGWGTSNTYIHYTTDGTNWLDSYATETSNGTMYLFLDESCTVTYDIVADGTYYKNYSASGTVSSSSTSSSVYYARKEGTWGNETTGGNLSTSTLSAGAYKIYISDAYSYGNTSNVTLQYHFYKIDDPVIFGSVNSASWSGDEYTMISEGNGVYSHTGSNQPNGTVYYRFKFDGNYYKYGDSDGAVSTDSSNPTNAVSNGTSDSGSGAFTFNPAGKSYSVKVDLSSATRKTWVDIATAETLTTPTIAFDNSGAVNNGDSAILRVSNHQTITGQGDITMSYELYKNNTKMTSGYSCNDGVFTITSYADGDSFTVKAVTTDTAHYTDSAMSDAATLAVYEPKYALLGCADSQDIEKIINSQGEHESTKAYGWPSTTPVDDATHFNSTVVVDRPTETPGVYKITFTTKKPTEWDNINIGLYQKTVGQRGFSYDGTDYTSADRGKELKVPSAGLSNVGIINGTSSMQFKPNITYTITIDQRGATDVLSITSNAADITAIARVKTFNPTTGELNTSVSNATAAVGTATASPSAGKTPFTSNLTATVADSTKYDFEGWYTDADCTTQYNANATTTANVSTDVTYYALFTQKTPDTVNLTIDTTGSGTVTPTSGTHSGSGSSYTIYPGATVVFTATPGTDYGLDTVTSTSGTVTKSGNTVTVSNITEAATVSFTFTEVQTYNVTLQADSSSYGSLTATYTNKNNSSVTTEAITSSTTITVKQDTVVTLTATAGSSGSFDGWTVNSGTYQRSKDTPLSSATLNLKPTSDISLTANFSSLGTVTSLHLLSSKSGNDPRNMSDSNLTVYEKGDGYYVTIPASSMNGTNNVYFAISDSTSYTGMWNQNDGDSILVSVASGSANYIEAEKQNYYVDKSYNFARARLKDSSVSNVTLHMWQTNNGKTLNYEFSVGDSGSGGDTPDVSGLTKLYVLDGIDMDGSVGTNSFGDSTIISVNSGVAKYNYYDATGSDTAISSSTGRNEGGLIYYYAPGENLDFRVQTTIASGHQALGVRAFVMNGMTYPAKKSADGVYYADITLDAEATAKGTTPETYDVLEVIPVYYNKLIETNGDYIKFYVDANTIGDKFGKTIGYSVWYKDKTLHGETGGYPGQPLLSDGTLLYGYFPKYYVSNDAASVPPADQRSAFAGVLLSNLAEHNDTHKDVLRAWNASTDNYQSFDYEDPVEIAKIADVDTIEFVAKYKELTTTHRKDYNSRTLNGDANKEWPASISPRPTNAAAALEKGFEYLTDIDGKRVNIFNQTGTLTGDPLYVVSAGNQQISPNDWDTVWEVYTASGTSIAAARPVDFINPSSSLQTTLESYTNSPVLINYEGWLAGENNTGTRLDGRWLYSKSTDDTTLRLRVATKDNSGNLTFMTNGISWAEISDGTHNGALEAADTTNLTKILNLDDRTTEVTAKINPVGYTVEGMYMLGASYSDTANNGYSTKISDYDNMNVVGTATSFVNSKDNRMVIVVEKIPASNLVITHQMYGGPGAHKIKGFYYVKAALYNSSGTKVKDYNSGDYKLNSLTLADFTTDAPKNGGYKLKVTIKTVMSGSASFYQWYENDHNNGYKEINSETARGSVNPVEKEIEINVDSLYGESTLNIQNLDYYSDLQSADNININHLLLPSTISADLDGDTYTQVTVLTNTGTTVSGGAYAAKMKTTEVSADFITTDNAANGYQLKVEIWTIPDSPAEFDAFYKNTTTEMTSHVDGTTGITYTTGQTKTFAGNTYTSATVMIPISYFFKNVWDEDEGANVLQFDSTKQSFYLYSSLKMEYKYVIEYQYNSRIWGTQSYKVPAASNDEAFTVEEFNKYINEAQVTDATTGSTVSGISFKNDALKKEFLASKAPYEDNFRETITWNFTGATVSYYDSGKQLSIKVTTSSMDDDALYLLVHFPFECTVQTTGLDVTRDSEDKVQYVEGKTNYTARPLYMHRYTVNNKYDLTSEIYLQAPESVWKNGEEKFFSYWSLKDQKTGREYAKCYSRNLNYAFYQDTVVDLAYDNTSALSPSDNADKGTSARIEFLENTRNQWNSNPGTSSWNPADRVISDFVLYYNYQGKQINTIQNMKAGLVFETVGNLDKDEHDDYITNRFTYASKHASDNLTTLKDNVTTFIGLNQSSNETYLKSEFNTYRDTTRPAETINKNNGLDNKNEIEYYYTMAANGTKERELKYYRVYSYLKDANGNVVAVSDPIYLTVYDIASIQNGSAEMPGV